VDRGDVAEGGEVVLGIFDGGPAGHVLDVNVVVDLAEVLFVLGSELDSDSVFSALSLLKGLLGGGSVAEANEAVALRLVVTAEGYLAGDDLSVLSKRVFEACGGVGLGDFAHKHVVFGESLDVGAKELVLEGQGTAVLTVDVEVAEGLADLGELGVVVDLDDGCVERLVEVTANLGLALDVVAGLVFDDLGKLGGGELTLGQVVEVDQVGLDARDGAHFFVFCFWGKVRVLFFVVFFLFVERDRSILKIYYNYQKDALLYP